MSNVSMAMNARHDVIVLGISGIRRCFNRKQIMDKIFVAVQACILCHSLIARLSLNWVVIVLKREGDGVKKTVVSFGDPFANKIVR